MKDRSTIPSPFIIIGMHRSGTAMIAQMLEELGLFTGRKKQQNHEALFFMNINDWLLHQSVLPGIILSHFISCLKIKKSGPWLLITCVPW